jgi:HAD superfamily hydrolase (TIGR01484 family)
MRYHVLATDYDGTLAHDGVVSEATLKAMERLLATGRKAVLVTGRELDDLRRIFTRFELFEWVVAENGGLLYQPSTNTETPLADAPSAEFVEALKQKRCAGLSVGRTIVATWEPYQHAVLEAIQQFGLELQVTFNKGAVMVLPSGVNKASGLTAALQQMGISSHNVVGIGDAENDHMMLRYCGLSVAVSNALPAVKETADWVTSRDHGDGVIQLIDEMVDNDLAVATEKSTRPGFDLGNSDAGPVEIAPYGGGILLAGPSASGKSTVATHFIETAIDQKYQVCVIDPEGDYENFDQAVVLGGPDAIPQVSEVLQVLSDPTASVVISMTGLPIPDRPPFFLALLPQLLQMRAERGRPHWLVLDEAHHLMPSEWIPPTAMLPDRLNNMLLITVHPDLLSRVVLQRLDVLLATGTETEVLVSQFAAAGDALVPKIDQKPQNQGEVLLWNRTEHSQPVRLTAHPCKQERRRHRRKYAEGELSPDHSFYFHGPENALNLRAQNLMAFLQLGDGVDDATWEFHLKNGDYSRWLRESIKDNDVAEAVARVEANTEIDPLESRRQVRAAIEHAYTLAAPGPLPVPGAF